MHRPPKRKVSRRPRHPTAAPSAKKHARARKDDHGIKAELTRAKQMLDAIRDAIAETPKRERRDPFFRLQLAAEKRAVAEVEALEGRGQERGKLRSRSADS